MRCRQAYRGGDSVSKIRPRVGADAEAAPYSDNMWRFREPDAAATRYFALARAANKSPMPSFLTALRLNLSARLMRWLLGRLPNEPTLLARMGLIQLNLGKCEEAVEYLERSLKILPNEPYVHL